MLWMLIVMVLAVWLMSRFARKQQEKMTAQQNARIEEAMVPGTWVRTRAGFYGKVVEVDGDVVTLATALGDESLWAKSSILGAEEPPLASLDEDGAAEADAELGALDTLDEVVEESTEPASGTLTPGSSDTGTPGTGVQDPDSQERDRQD